MVWLEAVGIPYLVLLALAVIEGRGGWETFARKFIELGIQACVLGLGVSGALFANDAIRARLGDHASAYGIALVFVDLIVVGFCLHLRSAGQYPDAAQGEVGRAFLSIVLGLLILGINSEVVFHYY
jgi:hypothetical protein